MNFFDADGPAGEASPRQLAVLTAAIGNESSEMFSVMLDDWSGAFPGDQTKPRFAI